MRVIGLMGGVASGKSLVARHMAALGAGVLDADRAGHEVLRTAAVESAARTRWGEAVFGPDGRIDRAKLAGIVFAGGPAAERERKYLEKLTHPEIGRRLAAEADQLAAAGAAAAVLDAALLLEAGWDRFCDRLLFVDAPRELRLARARERGWSEEEFAAREAAQLPLEEKRKRADAVIDGSGALEHARAQAERLWPSLIG